MHPILANRSAALSYAALWLGLGLVDAIVLTRVGAPLLAAAGVAMPAALLFGFIALSSWYLCRIAPLRGGEPLRLVAVHGGGAAISSALWIALLHGWAALVDRQLPGALLMVAGHEAPIFLFALLGFLLSSAAHFLYITFEESRAAEKRALTMQMLATDAELRALRSQITPHFLFNALNSINALTSSDAAGARRMCLLLSDFLRGTLQLSTQERIPLAQELSLIDQFLAIEQVRFGERLQIERHVAAETAAWQIPPLLLQPLVENAITHGIADVLDRGTLRLEATLLDGGLTLVVENPRDPAGRRRAGAGMGLLNVRRRLETAYGAGASLRVDVTDTTFRVAVTLPASAQPAAAAVAGAPAGAGTAAAAGAGAGSGARTIAAPTAERSAVSSSAVSASAVSAEPGALAPSAAATPTTSAAAAAGSAAADTAANPPRVPAGAGAREGRT